MNEVDIDVKMRFIGYYMSDDHFMRTEAVSLRKQRNWLSFFGLPLTQFLKTGMWMMR